jgi:hypothetical protein
VKSIPLGIAVATLALGAAVAQTTTTPGQTQPAAPGMPPATSSGTQSTRPLTPATPGVGTPAAPGTGMPAGMTNNNRSGTTGSSPTDSNGAVNTSSANAPTPAKGANSFSQGEARRRIASNGFSNVNGLRKDRDGIWRGTAQKDGQHVNVWLDYRGNVGQQ